MVNPFISVINQVLPEPQAGLLNGILFGIRSNLPKDFYNALITTGTIHIIALSGQNISILTRVISEITLVFGRTISILLTIFSIVSFVIFVGPSSTIIRAALMGAITLIAVYFGRQSWALLSLILTAGIMLIINPSWIGEISFQLSFLATCGIILFVRQEAAKSTSLMKEIFQDLKINFKTTIAAQIFTIPAIWLHFHRISLIAPLSNVLIAWTITPIMILGFALSLLGFIFLPLGKLVALIVWVPLSFIAAIVNLTAKIPFASIQI